MDEQLTQSWQQLKQSWSLSTPQLNLLQFLTYLFVGGALAVYLRFLHGRCSATASDSDSVTRVFPLLTMITTAVIAVVQSSLALSLGLVGALSIVRFRAAIKEPEELIYLFLCIAIGLALGAAQPLLALSLVLVSSLFILGMHFTTSHALPTRMMLTVTGNVAEYFSDPEESIVSRVEAVTGPCSILRMDIEADQGQVRMLLPTTSARKIDRMIVEIRNRLPGCEFSYVDMKSAL